MSPSPRDSTPPAGVGADKARLRRFLRQARAALDPADRQDQSAALARAVTDHLGRTAALPADTLRCKNPVAARKAGGV